MYKESVKWTFIWSLSIALIFMGIYHFAGVPMLKMMTSDAVVVDASREYLPWLLLMPVVGCAAFTWDGIYIGATATRAIRNSMLWAVVGFFLSYWIFREPYGVQALWVGYMVHLVVRTVYLTAAAKKEVFEA
jgi:MATE family multidrug resistance protein